MNNDKLILKIKKDIHRHQAVKRSPLSLETPIKKFKGEKASQSQPILPMGIAGAVGDLKIIMHNIQEGEEWIKKRGTKGYHKTLSHTSKPVRELRHKYWVESLSRFFSEEYFEIYQAEMIEMYNKKTKRKEK